MTQDTSDIHVLAPQKRRGASLLTRLTMMVALAIAIAWFFSTDLVQRWIIARRSTHDLEQTVRLAPDTPWPFYELGVRYARQRRLPEAVKLFERARQAAPESSEIRLALGKAYLFSGDPGAATPELKRATELDSRNEPAFRYLATADRLTHAKPAALDAARRATELDPRDAEAWYQYGELFTSEDGDENNGRPFLKKAAELAPSDGVYAYAYGRSLADGSQFADAVPFLRKAVRALPNDPNTHFFLGLSLHRSGGGDSTEMVDELTKAVQLAPADFKGHFELGNVLEERSRFAEALPEFESAAKLNPSLGEIWFHLARMADRAGQPDKAAMARARFAAIRKYHAEFVSLINQLKANPTSATLQLKIGEVLEKQDKPKQAALQYLDVLSREPNNVQAQRLFEQLRQRMHWSKVPATTGDGGAP